MFKEYRIEIAVVAALLATIMLYTGNPFWPVGYIAAISNYICAKKGI